MFNADIGLDTINVDIGWDMINADIGWDMINDAEECFLKLKGKKDFFNDGEKRQPGFKLA